MTTPAPTLARLLDATANAVAAVRAGRSLSDELARLPAALRPGAQSLSFTVLRRLGGAMEVRAQLAPRNPPPAVEALLLTALALLWPDEAPPYPDHTLVDQAVAAAQGRTPAAAGFVNAVLRRFIRERGASVQAAQHSPMGAYNHPAWWVQQLRQDWPAQWQALLHEANRRPPMTLRVNARRTTAAAYIARLAHHGILAHRAGGPLAPAALGPGASAAPQADSLAGPRSASLASASVTSHSPLPAALATHAVVLAEPRAVTTLPGFVEGEVSVQDAAAQCAAPLLLGGHDGRPPLAAGARVLDACAAPGGKTAHLLELADIDLVALDVDAQRLARVHENLRRLRLDGATAQRPAPRVLAGDASQPVAWWDGRPFDAILLDAPCTASGIVRRHPDVRWLRRPADIAALAATQARMLQALWPLLAPGGRLLYATCSLFKAEGGHQIDAFLQRLAPGEARHWHGSPGHMLPLADNSAAREPPVAGASSDGFFYALLEKS